MLVLAVDDVPEMCAGVKRVLNKAGIDCDVASGYKDAMQMVADKDYDAILMDFQMPQVTGLQLTRMLRDNGFNKPIIGLTANPKKYSIEDMTSAGLNAYIKKPMRKTHFDYLKMDANTTFFSDQLPEPSDLNLNQYAAVVDIDYTLGITDDVGFALDTFDDFFNALPGQLSEFNSTFNSKDISALRALAHNMKGQVAYAGAPAISCAINEFHDLLKSSPDSDVALKTSFDKLTAAINEFITEYPEFRKEYGSNKSNTF